MKDIHRVAVPIFDNQTVEPDIEALATTTLIKQLQQDGTYQVTSLDRADAEIKGVITDVIRSQARAVTGNVLASSEFNLTVRLHLDVINPQTKATIAQRDVEGTSRFFVQNDVTSQERQAIPLAVEDASVQAASFLSEGW
ncbi:MAG: hypothetical protein JO069_22235 [Verrucomicrobia bacterium]|nr:hypothetical protein [Verrucomicrobiota bacterium]